MCGPRRDNCGDERSFASVSGHAAPSDAVVIASGRIVPVGVEVVVGGAVARRLVLDGRCTRGERFEIGGGPVQEVPHRLVGLLV